MVAYWNFVSYRLLLVPLLSLIVLSSTPLIDASSETVIYKCLKPEGYPHILVDVSINSGTADNVFGKGAESTCGVKSGKISGLGSIETPYRLFLNVSGTNDVTNGECGITRKGELVTLTIITRYSTGTYASSQDKETEIKCDFSKDITVDSPMPVNLVEEQAVEMDVNITLAFEGSPTELTVGQETRLELQVINPNVLSIIKTFRCWAMRSANDANKVLLLDDYCPVTGSPVSISFDHYISLSSQRSNKFAAFRFFDSDVLLIRCVVDLCDKVADCIEVKCGSRKKRSVSGKDRHQNIASTDTSVIVKDKISPKLLTGEQLPLIATLFPISVFLIVILLAVVIILAVKMFRRKVNRDHLKNFESFEN